jgi:hypothetical protein
MPHPVQAAYPEAMAGPIIDVTENARRAAPPTPQVRRIAWGRPCSGSCAGAKDLAASPGIAAFYGACFWAMAATLGAVFRNKPEYTMTIVSGCLLVGPFLAMAFTRRAAAASRAWRRACPLRSPAGTATWAAWACSCWC